jgi:perosamine synthetase
MQPLIPYGRHYLDEDDIQAVTDVLRHGLLTQGPLVEQFEEAIAGYVGARFAVACASGTAALHMAAIAAGLGPRQTLVTSPITFVASANAALYVGADAQFAEIDGGTLNMSASRLAETVARHPETRVITPVHFAGLPCDMDAIKQVADSAGAVVIEDAAHALGATYPDGTRVGSCARSLMTMFSFHPVKLIAAGEGGLLTTNDEKIYRHLLRLRSHGINKLDDPLEVAELATTDGVPNPWYHEMQELGFHFRITDIQCALALSQFRKLDTFIRGRRALVSVYDEAFKTFTHLRPAQTSGRDRSGHHLYVVRIDFRSAGITRAKLMTELKARRIGTQVHYLPVPAHPHYRRLGHRPGDFPEALAYYSEALSIPLFYGLTSDQQGYVIDSLKELVG